MLIRFAALSWGPSSVTYGLDAVCNKAIPAPCINKPVKKRPKVLVMPAGMNSKAPNAASNNPIAIPFLKPVFFNKYPAGKEASIYEIKKEKVTR